MYGPIFSVHVLVRVYDVRAHFLRALLVRVEYTFHIHTLPRVGFKLEPRTILTIDSDKNRMSSLITTSYNIHTDDHRPTIKAPLSWHGQRPV
jgi:DNA-binding winged helix-turn-helix (wHTH) protein